MSSAPNIEEADIVSITVDHDEIAYEEARVVQSASDESDEPGDYELEVTVDSSSRKWWLEAMFGGAAIEAEVELDDGSRWEADLHLADSGGAASGSGGTMYGRIAFGDEIG